MRWNYLLIPKLQRRYRWNLGNNWKVHATIFCSCDYLSVTWLSQSMLVKTHWGRVTHICVSKLTIIGSDNGLSPGRRQAIIWTNAGILLIRTLGTNFSEILGKIHSFSFTKMHFKMSSAKWRLFSLGLNELKRTLAINILTVTIMSPIE